jgi:pilus assembly protein CpaB
VTPGARRRRGLLLLALSLASGALAASLVRDRVASVERRVGPLVSVAVAARDLPAGARLRAREVRLRRVPAAYVPRDSLRPEAIASGERIGGPVAAGSYLTTGVLAGSASPPATAALRPGERAVEVAVASGPGLGASAAPGTRVDVVVSTEPREGPGRTFVAIEGAPLLALRRLAGDGGAGDLGAGAAEGARGAATAVATLRVTARQAVYLTAAQNFAREVRLLARAPGDHRGIGRAAVGAGGL